MLEQLHFADNY